MKTNIKKTQKYLSVARAAAVAVIGLFAAASLSVSAAAAPAKVNVDSEIVNLKKSDPQRRLEAVAKLRGNPGDKKAGAALAVAANTEKNTHLKARMVEALGGFRQKETQSAALDALENDTSAEVRFSAANALGYIGDAASVPALIKTFTDENERKGVRFQAAGALASQRATEEIIAVFLASAESKDPDVRAQSVTSLSAIAPDDPRARDLARKMLGDKDAFVKKTAAARLEFMGVKQ